jgi:non-ribosomal peptide synthetase component E (peptide arylation enzyme)
VIRGLPDWLSSRAHAMPDRSGLSVASREWTFGELDEEASRVARRLHSLGVRSGDRVATLLSNNLASSILRMLHSDSAPYSHHSTLV